MTATHALSVAPTNTAQAQAWNGPEGRFWAAHASAFEEVHAGYDAALFDVAAVEGADQVLDVGCGTGSTTRTAARLAQRGDATGVDLSADMTDVARYRAAAEGLTNIRFVQADAQVHPFPTGSVDVVLSRTGAMFFGDPVAAFGNLARALRPGGRLALLVWQSPEHNSWFSLISTTLLAGRPRPTPPEGAPGPFSLSRPERTRELLVSTGFTDPVVTGVTAPMLFGPDADAALELVLGTAGWLLDGLDADARARAVDQLRDALAAHRTPRGVELDSAAWLVAARRRP